MVLFIVFVILGLLLLWGGIALFNYVLPLAVIMILGGIAFIFFGISDLIKYRKNKSTKQESVSRTSEIISSGMNSQKTSVEYKNNLAKYYEEHKNDICDTYLSRNGSDESCSIKLTYDSNIKNEMIINNKNFSLLGRFVFEYLKEIDSQIENPNQSDADKKRALPHIRQDAKSKSCNIAMQYISKLKGSDFEYLTADLLQCSGFTNINLTPVSNDKGVDILAEKNGYSYAFQCKRYSSNLGNSPIQEVHAGKDFYKCDFGVVITNSNFTKEALNLANDIGVECWDSKKLRKLILNYFF